MIFTAVAVRPTSDNMQLVIALFSVITAAFLMSYFRMIGGWGRKANVALAILIAITAVVYPNVVALIPIVAYEMTLDRQIAPGLISFAAIVRSHDHFELRDYLLLICVIGLAMYLAFRTDKLEKLETDNKKIRDEAEIKKEKLSDRNKELLIEQDKNIYTAQLAERNRIAREIHDNVGHMLSRSLLQVGAMMVMHKNEPVAEELKDLRSTLDTAMNNIRESVHDIRDEAIDIRNAALEIAEPLKEKFNLTFDCDIEDKGMPKDIKYATINIIKEAVSNIIKYSRNDNVDIRIYEHPSMYQIIIHDYPGFSDKDAENKAHEFVTPGNGMGLDNIRLRAEQLGGQASFTNGDGFRVFVRIPKKK